MSIQLPTGLGLDITLPDGAEPIAEPSAGPLSAQFSLPSGEVVSWFAMTRPLRTWPASSPGPRPWPATMSPSLAPSKSCRAALPAMAGRAMPTRFPSTTPPQCPAGPRSSGCLLAGGIFAGITLLTIDDGAPLDTNLVEGIVRGIAPARPSLGTPTSRRHAAVELHGKKKRKGPSRSWGPLFKNLR